MHHTVLLLGTLLTAFLGGGYVAWAEDFPCQGWGTTTFVYEADVVEACLNTDIDLNAGINRTGTTPLIGAVQLGDTMPSGCCSRPARIRTNRIARAGRR